MITKSHDVFLSCPMASVRSRNQYADIRESALAIKRCLEDECGLSVYFAGEDVDSKDGFDEPDFSFLKDRDALIHSTYFLLYYPSRVVSSVLVEAGMAIVLEKKAVYFVQDRKHLPFMLQHLDRVCPVKIYETKATQRILKLLCDHKVNLFEPWVEKPAMVQTTSEATSTAPHMAKELRPNTRIGPYVLVKRLGSGTFGSVWLGERRTSFATTLFALKFPRAEGLDLEDVKHEAQVWSVVSGHPNVVPVIEADIYDNQVVIVSEYVTDGSLAQWIENHWRSDAAIDDSIHFVTGILAGLIHLHSRAMVHRDLKPSNVLLQGRIPKIVDFGLARILASTNQSFSVGGTPAYMAPEAWEGQRTEQTDIWSLGVILYELVCGKRPYVEDNYDRLTQMIKHNPPPPLPATTPEPLQTVILKALARRPDERYRSAIEMHQDFTRLLRTLQ